MGSSGVNLITDRAGTVTPEDVSLKETVVSSSKEVILLVEKKKFNVDSAYSFAALDEFNVIVTDEIREKIDELNVRLI